MRKSPRFWSPEEIARLRELASTRSLTGAARGLGRDVSAVWYKARELGICFVARSAPPRWTRAEVLLLWEYAGRRTTRQLARKLRRSSFAIRRKAQALGIRLAIAGSVAEVARYLRVDYATVARHRNLLGQRWCTRPYPRGPELAEVQAIARSIARDGRKGFGSLKAKLVRLQRIAEGLE